MNENGEEEIVSKTFELEIVLATTFDTFIRSMTFSAKGERSIWGNRLY